MGQGHQPADRSSVNDTATALLLDHLGDLSLKATEDAGEIHGQHLGPLLGLDLQQLSCGPNDSGVIKSSV